MRGTAGFRNWSDLEKKVEIPPPQPRTLEVVQEEEEEQTGAMTPSFHQSFREEEPERIQKMGVNSSLSLKKIVGRFSHSGSKCMNK